MKNISTSILSLFFLFTISLNSQETVIAVWDFAENSLEGQIHSDFSDIENSDLGYLASGGEDDAAFTNIEPEGNSNVAYTSVTSSPNTGQWSNWILSGLGLGAESLVDGKLHFSISLKSFNVVAGTENASVIDQLVFILRDSDEDEDGDNHRLGGIRISPNNNAANVRVDYFNYNAGEVFGVSKMAGHFGGGNYTFDDANITLGYTLDFTNNTNQFWIGSPGQYGPNSYGFNTVGADVSNAWANQNNNAEQNIPATFDGKIVDHMQFQIRNGNGSSWEIDQVKISTGTYENTVEQGNSLTISQELEGFSYFFDKHTKLLNIVSQNSLILKTEVYEMSGKMILDSNDKNLNHNISFSNFENGIYLVRVLTELGQTTIKLLNY